MLQSHQLQSMSLQLKSGTPLAGVVVPAPKPRRRNLESEMQRLLIKWWRVNCQHFGVPECLLFSVPNGGNMDARRGSIMKAEGQRKGAPDLCLAVPRLEWPDSSSVFGLYLELKTPTGRLLPEQKEFHAALRSRGYKVEVVRSLEDGIKIIGEYLT